ncbi:hypothetical protein [Enterococcus sp. SMC-9]|uniref:hypothetical protein n=1 Tax=Enterococcus sp. SMC-9 TaxID=2862343 RepID=UPI001E397799|nr:hypothetical protein [Enterococcus sp. SMC-9]MCD1023489.1 hypothetical protein [Enterococcus sp. SMC-9]
MLLERFFSEFFFSDTFEIILNILTTVGTVGAVILSLYYSKKESRERYELDKKEQATCIYATSKLDDACLVVEIYNTSRVPIHDVFVISVLNSSKLTLADQISSHGYIKHIEIVPPGTKTITMESRGSSMGGKHDVPIVFFTDANNNEWVLDNKSQLHKAPNYEEKIIIEKLNYHPPYL